jgi:hypothetical protein
VTTREEDWESQRQWTEARRRRMAERMAEQERLHELDPYNVPMYLPVDDPEFPDENYTAGWTQEEGA